MNKKEDFAKKIIIALDVGNRGEALSLVNQLEGVEIFKVGLKLFTAEGPSLLEKIKTLGKKVFLDLKLHDIPNTVAEAVKVGVRHGVHMLTLHSSGGREMLEKAVASAAAEADKEGVERPLLLAVTVLTSLKSDQLREIGMTDDTFLQVLRLAKLAKEAGVGGVVCSPQEIEIVKKETGRDLLVVAPGIRPLWAAAHDQKRIMTPSLAIKKGADYLVIGRPITEAPSPQEAFLKILRELADS
ncbi:MAG: orotidine-5'-phosphate decarboxylase [Candidatus Aminicenantes bacterium]|nr:orotidine-5'-phosphate decarboxylase [Candidatus Aminicenantes bacterium]